MSDQSDANPTSDQSPANPGAGEGAFTPPNATRGEPETPPFRYNAGLANELETRWQDRWDADKTYATPNPGEAGFDAGKPKAFVLDMFPYPSGAGIHVGHPLGYIATDIYARYLRMTGHNVLHAMGFDSFGLPAEQYAVQTNTHPRITTEANIANMKRQLRRLGLGHDARRGVSTTDESFYRWTQWIFLQIYNSWYDIKANKARPISMLVDEFFSGQRATSTGRAWMNMNGVERGNELDKHRMAYLAEVDVNWCPMLGTVLANEEVSADGKSERGNYPVFRRPLKQWMMRITMYCERLLADLEPLAWPEPVKIMQRNWIGKSDGAYVDFPVSNRRIRVFTTRPDTLFGATYLVLSPEHSMVDLLAGEKFGGGPSEPKVRAVFEGAETLLADAASPKELIAAYRAYAASRSDEERTDGKLKTGVFIGAYAINPVNQQRLPIFIADYVLAGYGTGAIMAVPAHDDRDFAFAQVFGVPVVTVVQPTDGKPVEGCFSDEGIVVNSPPAGSMKTVFDINGLTTAKAKAQISAMLNATDCGCPQINYKLRDWLFSRQRYWGEPFPIVYDKWGHVHALPESDLPVLLPKMDNFQPESSNDPNAPPRPPLARAKDWVNVKLDLYGTGRTEECTRETNTMPNWAGSCWYYLRYLDPENNTALVGKDVERYWMNSSKADGTPHVGGVDLYVGGVEHAVLHLLYARFWHKVLFDLGHVGTREPFARLVNQGMVLGATYLPKDRRRGADGEPLVWGPADVEQVAGATGADEWRVKATGEPVDVQWDKMSKSRGNVVNPDDVVLQYGADTMRLYEMFMGPLEHSAPWQTEGVAGCHRFLQRAYRMAFETGDDGTPDRLRTLAPGEGSDRQRRLLHRTIQAVTERIDRLGFNTAISAMMVFVRDIVDEGETLHHDTLAQFCLLLAPFAPHLAEEVWRALGKTTSLAHELWPAADDALLVDATFPLVVQIQGKRRAELVIPQGTSEEDIKQRVLADAEVLRHLAGKTPRRVIYVPGKLINIVV